MTYLDVLEIEIPDTPNRAYFSDGPVESLFLHTVELTDHYNPREELRRNLWTTANNPATMGITCLFDIGGGAVVRSYRRRFENWRVELFIGAHEDAHVAQKMMRSSRLLREIRAHPENNADLFRLLDLTNAFTNPGSGFAFFQSLDDAGYLDATKPLTEHDIIELYADTVAVWALETEGTSPLELDKACLDTSLARACDFYYKCTGRDYRFVPKNL